MGSLLSIATKIDEQVSHSLEDVSSGEFVDTLVQLAPEVNKFLESCGPPSSPVPENPNPSPTAEESKAWTDAWNLKEMAGQANNHHLNVMARHIKKGKRKNGERIKESQAKSLAIALVENAKNQELPEIASAILESRQ